MPPGRGLVSARLEPTSPSTVLLPIAAQPDSRSRDTVPEQYVVCTACDGQGLECTYSVPVSKLIQ